ncbi:MAG: FAD-binding protein [Arenicella sp.]|nr:FAD-binding protein [Arenicella sp.]
MYSKFKLDRRDLLKGAALSIGTVGTLSACDQQQVAPKPASAKTKKPGIIGLDGRRVLPWSNWSGNQKSQPTLKKVPRSEAELVDLIKGAKQSIRCVGAGHSFSPLVPTDETLISLARLRGISNVDKVSKQVDIQAGTLLSKIGEPLWDKGLGLINMPDIDTQSLAGAIATSTHGTGNHLGSMSSDVVALELLDSNGEKHRCSAEQNSDLFYAACNNLGVLGVVTKVRMQAREKYLLKEESYVLRSSEAFEYAEQLRDDNRHFELFPFPHGDYIVVLLINETTEKAQGTTQLNIEQGEERDEAFRQVVKWTDAMPWLKSWIINMGLNSVEESVRIDRSYGIFGNLRNMRFNEMEYSVPAEKGLECVKEVMAKIAELNIDVVFPLELRYIKGDDVWLSPFYQRDSCSISCHNFQGRDYKNYFAAVEPIFWKYSGRPHWGKIHTLNADSLAKLYPKWQNFKDVRQQMDSRNLFLNKHLNALFVS